MPNVAVFGGASVAALGGVAIEASDNWLDSRWVDGWTGSLILFRLSNAWGVAPSFVGGICMTRCFSAVRAAFRVSGSLSPSAVRNAAAALGSCDR